MPERNNPARKTGKTNASSRKPKSAGPPAKPGPDAVPKSDLGEIKKPEEAMELLHEAAREKKEELSEGVYKNVNRIRGLVNQASANGRKALHEAKEKAQEAFHSGESAVREKAAEASRRVHAYPWIFLGCVAVGAFYLGYKLNSRKSEQDIPAHRAVTVSCA